MKLNSGILGWKIWYSNSVFSSRKHSWEELPNDDVQYVVVYLRDFDAGGRPRRNLLHFYDWYFIDEDGVIAGNIDKNREEVELRYNKPNIKRGKSTTVSNFKRICDEAIEDFDGWNK